MNSSGGLDMNNDMVDKFFRVVAGFFPNKGEELSLETSLRKDLGAGSGEIYMLISEALSDALNMSIIYEVTEMNTLGDILRAIKISLSAETTMQQY